MNAKGLKSTKRPSPGADRRDTVCLGERSLVEIYPLAGGRLHTTGWCLAQRFDLGGPTPALAAALQAGTVDVKGKRVFVPGCGWDPLAFRSLRSLCGLDWSINWRCPIVVMHMDESRRRLLMCAMGALKYIPLPPPSPDKGHAVVSENVRLP